MKDVDNDWRTIAIGVMFTVALLVFVLLVM